MTDQKKNIYFLALAEIYDICEISIGYSKIKILQF